MTESAAEKKEQMPQNGKSPAKEQPMHTDRRSRPAWFIRGMRDGIPVCLGYLAVSFALGIAARNAGLDTAMSLVMSLTMVASAGEFAAISLIGSGAGVMLMIAETFVVNLRYFLMSASIAQRLAPDTKPDHRFLLAQCMTDEIFGLSSAVQGYLCPFYTYGITTVSVAGWCVGTVLGCAVGSILPVWAADALGAAMYGMFLAIVIPPGRKDRFLLGLVVVSMAASAAFAYLPGLSGLPSGMAVILLTVLLAGIAAAVRPVEEVLTEEAPSAASGGDTVSDGAIDAAAAADIRAGEDEDTRGGRT